jgi:hypothetical protein
MGPADAVQQQLLVPAVAGGLLVAATVGMPLGLGYLKGLVRCQMDVN